MINALCLQNYHLQIVWLHSTASISQYGEPRRGRWGGRGYLVNVKKWDYLCVDICRYPQISVDIKTWLQESRVSVPERDAGHRVDGVSAPALASLQVDQVGLLAIVLFWWNISCCVFCHLVSQKVDKHPPLHLRKWNLHRGPRQVTEVVSLRRLDQSEWSIIELTWPASTNHS